MNAPGEAAAWHGPPLAAAPLLLSSPHSGRTMPASALPWLAVGEPVWREIEDSHVDRLLLPAVETLGLPLIAARHARAFCDLNRAEDEFDAGLFGAGASPAPPTEAVRAGHGLLPTMIAGRAVHRATLPASEHRRRVELVHRPFHEALAQALRRSAARWGSVLLVDCHSMPHGAASADAVLGDLHGASADPRLARSLERALIAEGLSVARNRPYAGGYITRRHAAPARGRHVVQLELARGLYMDERTREPHAGFAPLARALARALGRLLPLLEPRRQAAE